MTGSPLHNTKNFVVLCSYCCEKINGAMRFCSALVLGVALSVFPVSLASAQPQVPTKEAPIPEKEPIINPEAKALVEAMLAKYQALKSYSDKTQVSLEGGQGFPRAMRDGFPVEATLAWQRPSELRFEGTAGAKPFLALSDEDTLHAINPAHSGLWIEREQHPPIITTNPDGTKMTLPPAKTPVRLDAAVFDSGGLAFGISFMTDTELWPRTLKDVTVLALEPDGDSESDGESCRVVNVQSQNDQGHTSLLRLWIAKSDNLMRRMEMVYTGMGGKIIETHSQVRSNSDLPASTWVFQPPANAKPVEYFPSTHDLTPAIKVGDTLPTFSGDDLKGQPLELNSKSGKVTIVSFFLMSMGSYSLQTLEKLQKSIGNDQVQIVAVSGDALQGRLDKFAEKYKLTIPIYFDEGAMRNKLAQKFGVVGWPQTFIFGQDGKLQTISHMPGDVEFITGVKKLIPGTSDDAFFLDPAN